MCRCKGNVYAYTNSKFANEIIFTAKCMFIEKKKHTIFQQPYQNDRQCNSKKRNADCMTCPILKIPVIECVQILVGEYVIDDKQICMFLTHDNDVLVTGKIPRDLKMLIVRVYSCTWLKALQEQLLACHFCPQNQSVSTNQNDSNF